MDPEVRPRRVARKVEGVERAVVEPLAREPFPDGGHVGEAHREVDVAVGPAGVAARRCPRDEAAFQEDDAPQRPRGHDAQRGGFGHRERKSFVMHDGLVLDGVVMGAVAAPGFAAVHT